MPAAPLSALLVAGPELGPPSPLLAAKWDPNKRDYASLVEGMDPVDAHVLHALYVERGSGACVLHDGIDPPPSKMLDTLEGCDFLDMPRRQRRAIGEQSEMCLR